jgi:hypothetical protein
VFYCILQINGPMNWISNRYRYEYIVFQQLHGKRQTRSHPRSCNLRATTRAAELPSGFFFCHFSFILFSSLHFYFPFLLSFLLSFFLFLCLSVSIVNYVFILHIKTVAQIFSVENKLSNLSNKRFAQVN